MKFIKMRVRHIIIERDLQGKATRGSFEYPAEYNAEDVVWGPYYENSQHGGEDFMDIVFGVRNVHAAKFMQAHGKRQNGHRFVATELTEDEAIDEAAIMDVNRPERAVVHRDEVIIALDKKLKGEPLTQKETDALDPEHKQPGIMRFPSIREEVQLRKQQIVE